MEDRRGCSTVPSMTWRDVFNAILDNFPKCRMLQVRTWSSKQILTGMEQPVQLDNAFMLINDSSGNSRTGIHDDCFLASETDQGTWLDSALTNLY